MPWPTNLRSNHRLMPEPTDSLSLRADMRGVPCRMIGPCEIEALRAILPGCRSRRLTNTKPGVRSLPTTCPKTFPSPTMKSVCSTHGSATCWTSCLGSRTDLRRTT